MIASGVAIRNSVHSYEKTVEDTRTVLTAVGQTIFAQIDQAAAAATSGLSMRPTTLFVFGNPRAGTPLMVTTPLIGLDLPLKLLVWHDDDGATKVAYRTMASIAAAYALDGTSERFVQIDRALATLVDKIVTP